MKKSIIEKLKKLEIMKPQIREAVYLKIKTEYEQQIEEILKKLEKEKGYLLEEIKRMKSEENKILSKLEDLEINREELNVRFTLNEFSEEEHLQRKSLLEGEIEDTKTKVQELREKRRSFEQLTEEKTAESEEKEKTVSQPPTEEAKEILDAEEHAEVSSVIDETLPVELQSFDSIIPDTAKVPPAESDSNNFKEITIEEKIPEIKESSIDNIISVDILKDESFSLGEDVKKEDKLINENPLEAAKGEKDEDLSEFAKMLDNQMEPLGTLSSEQVPGNIEGLTCPKCGYVNKSDLFNCEKCGSELL
ncbi:MAG: hypothetical protein AB7T10_03135 [bacterium]